MYMYNVYEPSSQQPGFMDAKVSPVEHTQSEEVQPHPPTTTTTTPITVTTAPSSSTEESAGSVQRKGIHQRTPAFRPPLRRLSAGASGVKLHAAFKSPARVSTSPAVGKSSSAPAAAASTSAGKILTPSRKLHRYSPFTTTAASLGRTPAQNKSGAGSCSRGSLRAGALTKDTPESVTRDIAQLREQLATAESEITELSQDHCEDELQQYIDRLHEYNEIKDVGQLLLGKMAEVQGTTTAALYQQFGLDTDD